MSIGRFAEVSALLGDRSWGVPEAPEAADNGVAWLRGAVSRFRNGAVHARRRALVEAELARLDPVLLRRDAADRTVAVARGTFDVMSVVARVVPAEVLAAGLGLSVAEGLAGWVAEVASAYPVGAVVTAGADDAVRRLIAVCRGVPDEATAARIGLLVQACDATAGLIGNAVLAASTAPVDAVVWETLRFDPPVLRTTRVDAAGRAVVVDLAGGNRDGAVFDQPDRFWPDRFWPDRFRPGRAGAERQLTFGAGHRACPGWAQAVAIAAGVLTALRGCVLVGTEVEYEPSANLRVPAKVLMEVVA